MHSILAESSALGISVNSFIVAALSEYLSLPDLLDTGRSARFDPTPAACVVCGAPLPAGKARYCSDECKHEGHRRAAAESYRRKHQSQSSDT